MINMNIFKDKNINLKTTICILVLIMVISGFVGFIYETIFYKIDLGYWVKRGSSFGPWIPIYAVGGLLITLFSYPLKRRPWLVFIINCIVTGLLEYLTGYILFEFFNTRLWDYNVEIWNWGNVNGYICFRSIATFGVSSLILIYLLIPLLQKMVQKISERKTIIISSILGITFLLDILIYAIV